MALTQPVVEQPPNLRPEPILRGAAEALEAVPRALHLMLKLPSFLDFRALHAVAPRPQFLSTDRHLMQG
jgi:hypothetical protein